MIFAYVFYVNIHLFTWFGPCIDFYLNCMKWSWFIYHSAFKRGLIHSCTIFPLNSTHKIGIVVLHGMDTNFGKFSGVYGLILHTTVINFRLPFDGDLMIPPWTLPQTFVEAFIDLFFAIFAFCLLKLPGFIIRGYWGLPRVTKGYQGLTQVNSG